MYRSKVRKYEMLARVAEFGARNASLFPKKTAAVDLLKDLQTAVETMSEAKVEQSMAADQWRTSRHQRLEKRETLFRQLEAVKQTAAALNNGGFAGRYKANSSSLRDIARHTIDAAGPLQAEFLLHGLPSNFIESLKSASEELRDVIENQVAARDRRAAAGQKFDDALDEGLNCLRRFDALVWNTMSGYPSLMAAWEVARRLDPIRSSRKAGAPVADQPPPSAATSVATNVAV
jgi:hypothetical protein